jgi:hypothetical protein
VRRGIITEGPFLNAHGNWQVTLERRAAGETMSCVIAIEWRAALLVVTVY